MHFLFVCQVGLVEMSSSESTYRSLLGKLMQQESGPLVTAYGSIEELIGEVQGYVKVRSEGGGGGGGGSLLHRVEIFCRRTSQEMCL